MATKKTCICVGDLEERRREIGVALDIIEDLSRNKGYWMEQVEVNGDVAFVPIKGEETRVRMYNELITFVLENYG